MASITLTTTPADTTRVQAAATGLGYPDVKTMIIALVKQAVSTWEQQQNASTFASTSTTVTPT